MAGLHQPPRGDRLPKSGPARLQPLLVAAWLGAVSRLSTALQGKRDFSTLSLQFKGTWAQNLGQDGLYYDRPGNLKSKRQLNNAAKNTQVPWPGS